MSLRDVEIPCPSCDRPLSPGVASCGVCGVSMLLMGRFQIQGVLGQGGMGTVFSAIDTETSQPVAVKSQHFSGSDGFKNQEMLERSARILEHLDHPGLPRVLAHGALEGGRFVLVRECFDGQMLADRLHHTPLKREKIHALLASLLEILVELQDHVPPVIHRDIKPANIMFRTLDDWDPVLVDFGTVANLGGRAGMTMVGTPGYMAPEVLSGDASPASDVYSMGATMLEVITRVEAGELLREGGGMRFDTDRCLAGVEPTLRRIISKMVEPDRRDRYARAREAFKALSCCRFDDRLPLHEAPERQEEPPSDEGERVAPLVAPETGQIQRQTPGREHSWGALREETRTKILVTLWILAMIIMLMLIFN